MLSERKSLEFIACFQTDLLGGKFQTNPFAGFGQRPHGDSFCGIGGSPLDGLNVTPNSAVVPSAAVVLQHDRARQIRGFQKHMGENLAAGWHDEWRSGFPFPNILSQPGVAALQRPLATEDAPGLSGDPLGGMTRTGAQRACLRWRVINPC